MIRRVLPLEFFAVSGVLGDLIDFIGARRHAKLWRGTGGEVVGMPNVLIHKASELKAETRVVLEAELGRSLQDDEEVSIMAFVPHPAPAGENRREAAHKLQDHFQRIDQKLKGVPEEGVNEALDEALRQVRPGYRERE